MSTRIDKDENFGIIIEKFHIDNNCYLLFLDINIQKGNYCIYNIEVSFDGEDYIINLPQNYSSLANRDFPTIRFNELKDWINIKQEIKKYLSQTKWVKEYFKLE